MPECFREDSGVGQWLLRTRIEKGVSLDAAAEATRISKNYIDAMEREDFTKLPAPAYCKGFIRLYAVFLGISPDEAVSRYEAVSGSTETVSRGFNEKAAPDTGSDGKPLQRFVMPLILFSIVIFMSLLMNNDQNSPKRHPADRPEPVKSASPSPAHSLLSSSRTAALQPTASSPPADPSTAPASPSPGENLQQGGLVLSLKINHDSWLNVDIDGLVSKQYDLKAGDLIEWKAESVITLDIGNAGGVEGEVNDKPLPSLGAIGKKSHAVIRPDSVVVQ